MKIHHIRLQTQIFNNYKTEKVLQKQSQNPPLNSSNCSSRVLNIFFRELHPLFILYSLPPRRGGMYAFEAFSEIWNE